MEQTTQQTAYDIVYKGGTGEIVEKKSRFIANVIPVSSENEAFLCIESLKKEYWDARHNCYAFVLGRNNEIARYSDDGEPSGTAGKPILEVLLGSGVKNTLIVVTRYFGGTLLGTGGLVRAYSKSAQAGLEDATIITKTPGKMLKISTDYQGLGKIQYIAATLDLSIYDVEYTDSVTIKVLTDLDSMGSFIKKVTESTGGRAEIEEVGSHFFAKTGSEVLLFSS